MISTDVWSLVLGDVLEFEPSRHLRKNQQVHAGDSRIKL
ncbi:hypothetical protein APHWI1_1232 [Anaplasma phagocytophilum str. ApWI1]|uniref:Uncharacterized protein n=1 Tax=Anaplasma phagocytophilum str. ApWI1 TaxID=1359155 RepID=A0A0F3PV04_ANAPH|nr:hypothetical protein APHHGE2_0460 [Anaplasma phagocytophilum str. HGE2]KJV84185.1 hypothetical protein APHWI1_1232 [Anaplasma phagocytophilum str. ApWI1]KJV88214.1 hypothetical protein APHNYW_0188 [Anaplasma phagocytophilum str. ApNYW]KJZ98716.1 hypothetical protein APHCR_1188 [Anaplasma phagocytophilum str. CR1007]KKA00400.1 hypothetical protein APHDU1_0987 [Anaplasma phagocytophilum]